MKRVLVVLAVSLATVTFASPAAAKTPAENYAACLAQSRSAEVAALLHAQTAEAASRPYSRLADDDRCFNQVFGTGPFRPEDAGVSLDMLRGRLAEQALLAQSAQVAALQPLPLQEKRYLRPWFAATGRNPAVDEMGACMADTDPAGIAHLIQTGPGSADESAAIANLSPALTKCLSAGTRLDANRMALRAALADALYQRLTNPALSLVGLPTERGH
jgi:hypothetical protein